jgi:hypothetical protein
MEEADGPLVFAHACKLGLEGLQDHSSIDGGSAERSAPGTTADALDIDVAFALGTGALAKLLDAALAELAAASAAEALFGRGRGSGRPPRPSDNAERRNHVLGSLAVTVLPAFGTLRLLESPGSCWEGGAKAFANSMSAARLPNAVVALI